MIQIYSPSNMDFSKNGDMTLFPESCKATSELGGSWFLEITHPIDEEGRWRYIEREAVLSVPTFMGENQLYRIDAITDKTFGEISAKAYPIFFDSADDLFLLDTRPTKATGQQALNEMTKGSKYSGQSDITSVNTAYFVRRNLMSAISGEESPTFLELWGGEPLYNNHKVIINERAGGDYGVEIRYGKNLESVSVKEDMSEVVTRIVPVAFNGRMHSKSYIDSPLIGKYVKKYIKEIRFEDVKLIDDVEENEETDELIVCQTQAELDKALEEKCQEQFDSGIDLYKLTMDISVVELENIEEYKDFKDLVKIGLGDTVKCHNSKLGIDTKARAIKIVWDCIKNEVEDVVLGDYQKDILKDIGSAITKVENITNPNGSVNAEKIQGIINGINAQLRYQKNAAQKQDVRAILFEDLDEQSELYGALAIGTQGIQIAKERTLDGRDWNWTTAITAKGMIADALITGLIADKKGKTYWNLDTGEFVLSPETEITWGQVAGTEDVAKKDDIPTEQQITKITKDTITTEYVNALKVKAGSVDAERITGETITGKKIVGSTFTNEGLEFNFWPIVFTTKDGKYKVSIGAGNGIYRDTTNGTTCMISGSGISAGRNNGDGFYGDVQVDPLNGLKSKPSYSTTTSDAPNVNIDSTGSLTRSSSSSKRYKEEITEELSNKLDPKRLYDMPVKMFKYKKGYLKKGDSKEGKDIIGFIVEDFEKIYPEAVQYVDGMAEMWNANILIPAMLKLIQEQNERLKKLEGENAD